MLWSFEWLVPLHFEISLNTFGWNSCCIHDNDYDENDDGDAGARDYDDDDDKGNDNDNDIGDDDVYFFLLQKLYCKHYKVLQCITKQDSEYINK